MHAIRRGRQAASRSPLEGDPSVRSQRHPAPRHAAANKAALAWSFASLLGVACSEPFESSRDGGAAGVAGSATGGVSGSGGAAGGGSGSGGAAGSGGSVGGAAGGASGAGGSPTSPHCNGAGRILFHVHSTESSGGSAHSTVYSVCPDGTTLQRLLPDGEGFDTSPSWHPDGERVLFLRRHQSAGESEVLIQRLAGGAPTSLHQESSRLNLPLYSPDGEWIAFMRYSTSSPTKLMVIEVNAQDSSPTRLTTSADGVGDEGAFSWVDDERVVMRFGPEPARHVRLFRRGHGFTDLAGPHAFTPAASPHHETIVFAYQPDSSQPSELWQVNLTDGQPAALADPPVVGYVPCWGPGGSRIAFVEQETDKLMIVDYPVTGPPREVPLGVLNSEGTVVLSPGCWR